MESYSSKIKLLLLLLSIRSNDCLNLHIFQDPKELFDPLKFEDDFEGDEEVLHALYGGNRCGC